MKITTKLGLLTGAMVLALVLLTGYTLSSFSSVANGYDGVINNGMANAQAARVMQVTFKKEVQNWKDTLLRGSTPADMTNYSGQFHDLGKQVDDQDAALVSKITDPAIKSQVQQFGDAHKALDALYNGALATFQQDPSGLAYRVADKAVRGKDRPPTNLIDGIVAAQQAQVDKQVKHEQSSVSSLKTQAIVVAILIALASIALTAAFAANVSRRIRRVNAVTDRLANADIEGLEVNISGNDEIAALGSSLKGVVAAFDLLFSAAAQAEGTTETASPVGS